MPGSKNLNALIVSLLLYYHIQIKVKWKLNHNIARQQSPFISHFYPWFIFYYTLF